MIKYTILYLIIILSTALGYCQEKDPIILEITDNKTTHLIFSSPVQYFDYGTQDVGVLETPEGNIIKVKAAVEHFLETNLTVMTSNNVFYSFLLRYNSNPKKLNYFFDTEDGKIFLTSQTAVKQQAEIKEENANTNFEKICNNLISENDKRASYVTGIKKDKITVVLKNVLVDSKYIYLVLDAVNESAVNYDVDFIKFFVKPKKKNKKTSIQDLESTAIFKSNVPNVLIAQPESTTNFVYVFDKFTVSDDKKFVMELWEKNGERSIELEISNRALLNATPLK